MSLGLQSKSTSKVGKENTKPEQNQFNVTDLDDEQQLGNHVTLLVMYLVTHSRSRDALQFYQNLMNINYYIGFVDHFLTTSVTINKEDVQVAHSNDQTSVNYEPTKKNVSEVKGNKHERNTEFTSNTEVNKVPCNCNLGKYILL